MLFELNGWDSRVVGTVCLLAYVSTNISLRYEYKGWKA